MALRTKTIEYAFPLQTDVDTSGTARDFAQITIYIPESSPTFRSVVLENTAYTTGGTAASVTAVLQGIALGAVARNDATVTQTLTNSGEDQAFIFLRDVTSYFTTNWTGTSMTADCRLTITGTSTINGTAKLIITYQYDDSAETTRVKTVKIPIDGNTGALTTTLANVGGVANQIPALDTFLPEASIVYRDIFFETYVHTGAPSATNDRELRLRFNGATTLGATYEGGLQTDYPIKRIDKISGSFSTATAQNVEASTSNTSMPFPCLCGVLYVTYEYDHDNSTSIMNSIQISAFDESGWSGGATVDDASVFTKHFLINEDGATSGVSPTLELKQSGILMSMIDAGAIALDLRVGSQTSRVFNHAASDRAGAVYHMRRIDSGATGGSGYSIGQRGWQSLTTKYFTNSTTLGSIGSNPSAIYFINYISEKHTEGDGVHNHTTYWLNRPYTAVTLGYRQQYSPTITPNIPESDYYVSCNCYNVILQTIGTTSSTLYYSFQAESSNGGGWAELHSSNYNNDAEMGPSITWVRAGDPFKRYPNAPSSQMDIETVRDYKFEQNPNITHYQVVQMLTYTSKTYRYSGSFQNADSFYDTNIKAYAIVDGASDSGKREIYNFSVSADSGTFDIPWYLNNNPPGILGEGFVPNIVTVVASNYPNSLSYNGNDASNINFDFAASEGGGPTYYAY
jgi:hypothetical protein